MLLPKIKSFASQVCPLFYDTIISLDMACVYNKNTINVKIN